MVCTLAYLTGFLMIFGLLFKLQFKKLKNNELHFQRLMLILISMAMILCHILIYNARENISYFYTPSEINISNIAINQQLKIIEFVEIIVY